MRRITILALAVSAAVVHAQPINSRQFVSYIKHPPRERSVACRPGCYMLTQDELLGALQNAGRVALLRQKRSDSTTKGDHAQHAGADSPGEKHD